MNGDPFRYVAYLLWPVLVFGTIAAIAVGGGVGIVVFLVVAALAARAIVRAVAARRKRR